MSDERWRERIHVEPDGEAARASVERARRTALSRFDEAGRARSLGHWPAAALAAAALLTLWVTTMQRPVEMPPAAETRSSKVQFVMSDGTKVQWVFNDGFKL